MNGTRLAALMFVAALLPGCAGREPKPAALDRRNEACQSCRMPVSEARLASQLVAAGEEPLFFDDLGCLRDYLIQHPAVRGTVAYVVDHRSGAWILAGRAVFSKCGGIETPMGSHLVAHADAASREADPATRGGAAVPPREIFGPSGPPGAAR
jgi:copper chaperone NosL